jgi:CubicO group peptidase (beta-lactamase class C family)
MEVARRVAGVPIDRTRAQIALERAAPSESEGPALVVGVVTSDGLVAAGAWGLASLEHRVSASESTAFYVASLSKQFTALCMLLAAERGELRLDDPLVRWLPELPVWAQTVDLTHLLWHTAGLPEYLDLVVAAGRSPDDVLTQERILEWIAEVPDLAFPPGAQCVYSNTGYWLLALVLGRATGTSLRAFAHRHVFEPLGMLSSCFHDDRLEVIPNLAEGYAASDAGSCGRWRTCFEQVGDGGLVTSLRDLARWESALLAGLAPWSSLASRAAQPRLVAGGDTSDWRAGVLVAAHHGEPVVMAGGTGFGYRAFSVRSSSSGVSVIALSNHMATDVRASAFAILDGVLGFG